MKNEYLLKFKDGNEAMLSAKNIKDLKRQILEFGYEPLMIMLVLDTKEVMK